MTGPRRFLDRTKSAQERQAKRRNSFDPGGLIRLAGFGAALMVFLAVWIGWGRTSDAPVGWPWGVLYRLSQPAFLGASALELIALAIAGLLAWRYWRRMQGR
jgi:hypothetical protein